METPTSSQFRQTAWKKMKSGDMVISHDVRAKFATVQDLFVRMYARSILSSQQFLSILRMSKELRDELYYYIERLSAKQRLQALQQCEKSKLSIEDVTCSLLKKRCPVCEWKRRAKQMADRNSATGTRSTVVWQERIDLFSFSNELNKGCLFLSHQAQQFTCEVKQTPIRSQVRT